MLQTQSGSRNPSTTAHDPTAAALLAALVFALLVATTPLSLLFIVTAMVFSLSFSGTRLALLAPQLPPLGPVKLGKPGKANIR